MAAPFKTRLTELFGIQHPILAGGLMWLADARYVAAVVKAGAMGFITMKTFPDPGRFRAELRLARELAGGRPFGVNIYLSQRPDGNAIVPGHVAIMLEEGVRHVETSGLPPKELLPPLKEAGCTVIHKVSAVRHAVSAQKLGVDAVAVVGAECGGHPGIYMIGTIVQALRAAQSVEIPLAVGGGIGHGAQLVAALAMGADAVLLGTRMLVAEEIWSHPRVKERVVAADETHTRVILQSLRNTYRVLDNADAQAVARLEAAGVGDHERYRPLVGGQRQFEAYESGDWNRGVLSMGQAAAFADRIEPVAVIVERLLAEARGALAGLDQRRAAPLEAAA
jgi:NAD(P)H-dependent flavin oxidoreductase YrpB (nitropropane dioxygenase family)